jgi:restriction system protein
VEIIKKRDVIMEQENRMPENQKYCKHCGQLIDKECIICPKCGKQVEQMQHTQPNVVINNTNQNQNVNVNGRSRKQKECNKWVAFLLCLFLGPIGAHKFYEGKGGMGVLYIFTAGLFFIGAFIDLIIILTKPNPYYV